MDTLIEKMAEAKLIRRHNGFYTPSPLGLNLVEKHLLQKVQPGTIGSACDIETIVSLEALRLGEG